MNYVATLIACSFVSATNAGLVFAVWAGRIDATEQLILAALAPWLGLACSLLAVLLREEPVPKAALASAEQAESGRWQVPPGWKLVPVEPTEEMLQAANDDDGAYTLRVFGPGVQRVMQGPYDHYAAMLAAAPEAPAQAPIDMLLFCPACGTQHIDASEPHPRAHSPGSSHADHWTNPPHRSHLCHGCGHIWRPADVPTNGVAAIKTKGKDDSPVPEAPAQAAPSAGEVERDAARWRLFVSKMRPEEVAQANALADAAMQSKEQP